MEGSDQNASQNQNLNLVIPSAIILAGLLIAGAIFYSNGGGGNSSLTSAPTGGDKAEQTPNTENFRPVESGDHIRGNPDAEITLVEFSDFECPFCKAFHPTLTRLVEEYDDVRWVYRHFPLTSIHAQALPAAIASECAAKLGGNNAFWAFSDALFDGQESLGSELYKESALALGLDAESFNECLSSEEALAEVQSDLNEAITSGGGGTPFSVIITPSEGFFSFSGALAYEQVEAIINQVRAQ